MAEKIIIADDHPMFRDGMSQLVSSALPEARLFEAGTMDEVRAHAESLKTPDMFILDLLFPGMNPPATLEDLRQAHPMASIVIVSMLDDARTIDQVMATGIDGFIVKSVAPAKMLDALLSVRAGQYVIARPSLAELTETAPSAIDVKQLTLPQIEILAMISAGHSNKQIARKLDLSHFTVRNHISLLMRNFNTHSRAVLIERAVSIGCAPLIERQSDPL